MMDMGLIFIFYFVAVGFMWRLTQQTNRQIAFMEYKIQILWDRQKDNFRKVSENSKIKRADYPKTKKD